MRSAVRLVLSIVVVLLGQSGARAATEYLYRLDGVADLSVHVEGHVAVVDSPSIADGVQRMTFGALALQPQRYVFDAQSKRLFALDLAHKTFISFTPDEMRAVKASFLQLYWDSKRDQMAALPPAEQAKMQRYYQEWRTVPKTSFGAPKKGTRPTVLGDRCQDVDYDTDGKLGGTACIVPWAALQKRQDGQSAGAEAEALFSVLAALNLFKIQFDSAVAPGLVAELQTVPGPTAHSLHLTRVRKTDDDPALSDKTGFYDLGSEVRSQPEKQRGKAFVDKAALEAGVERLPSGALFKLLSPGKGVSPNAPDRVKVSFRGTLIDGTEFDSSNKRGTSDSFPLDRAIPCWTEGLQKMKVGERARLICPSYTAYGNVGRPPAIPGGATLIFEVELLDVVQK